MQVNAPPSFFQGSYLFFSCQEHKITSMDCEGLSKEEIQAAAAELTYLQTSALKGAAFGATFSPPQVAAPLTPATDPFRSQPSTPFSNFSGTTLVPTPTHGPLQETPSKFQKPAPSPFKGREREWEPGKLPPPLRRTSLKSRATEPNDDSNNSSKPEDSTVPQPSPAEPPLLQTLLFSRWQPSCYATRINSGCWPKAQHG